MNQREFGVSSRNLRETALCFQFFRHVGKLSLLNVSENTNEVSTIDVSKIESKNGVSNNDVSYIESKNGVSNNSSYIVSTG